MLFSGILGLMGFLRSSMADLILSLKDSWNHFSCADSGTCDVTSCSFSIKKIVWNIKETMDHLSN